MANPEKFIDGRGYLSQLIASLQETVRSAKIPELTAPLRIVVDQDSLQQTKEDLDRVQREAAARTNPSGPGQSLPGLLPPSPASRVAEIPPATPAAPFSQETDARRPFWSRRPGTVARAGGDYAEDLEGVEDVRGLGAARWGKVREGGALHTLREAGKFGDFWGDRLAGTKEGKDLGAWTGMAAKGEGRKIIENVEGIEKAGARITTLMETITKFGLTAPESVKAAKEIQALQGEIKTLGDEAEGAAGKVGGGRGAATKQAIADLKEKAVTGGVKGDGSPVGPEGVHMGSIRQAITNPMGYVQQQVAESFLSKIASVGNLGAAAGFAKLSGMGAMGTGAAVAAVPAALAGGFWGGMKINDVTVDNALEDARAHLADNTVSAGAGLDIRGNALFSADRKHQTTKLNMDYIRRGTAAFGMGFAPMSAANGGYDGHAFDLMDNTYKTANRIGVDGGALAGYMGQSAMAGAVDGSSPEAMKKLLERIAGSTEEASKYGVQASAHLSTIASLQQMAQAKAGYLTEGGSNAMLNLQSLLNASGNPALKDKNAQGQVGRMLADQDEGMKVYGINRLLGKDGKVNASEARRLLGKDGKVYDDMVEEGYSDREIARAAAETGQGLLERNQEWLGKNRAVPAWIKREKMLGSNGPIGQDASFLRTFREGKSVSSDPTFDIDPNTGKARKEDNANQEQLTAVAQLVTNVDKTARSFEQLNVVIGQNIEIERQKLNASAALWGGQGQDYGTHDPMNAYLTGKVNKTIGQGVTFEEWRSSQNPRGARPASGGPAYGRDR